jgi:alpha-amylase/alpha-mannosidase (GH57 family)
VDRYICIHGHFYQPPRENPWLEEIELQDSAYPYHDWNERISAECYAPNGASRILDPENRIFDIVNNYSKISFNFGPTLFSWMERHDPEAYQAVLEADQLSLERFSGHGSAIAQVYNHTIMPLANARDKYTQTVWGLEDFQKRFGRFPEGIWLPETAVDLATLEVLAELGIKFTILAPRQAKRVRKMGKGARWREVSDGKVDPSQAYLCVLPSGKQIALFFYDGPIAQDLAFGGLLKSGEAFAQRLLSSFAENRDWPQIIHVATDGETYGHHHRYGDMALAYCLYFIEARNLAKITNYGEYVEKHPPTHQVEIFENSSWSCIHGVERWRDNCGCNSGMKPGWTQAWRKPLREALDGLRERLIPFYEAEAAKYLQNPWQARNDYIDVILDRARDNVERFFEKYAGTTLSHEEKQKSLKLLEMQRNAMLMYTSCGWFFDEISGIETTQVLQYAARAIQLAEELSGLPLESDFLQALEKTPSNLPEHGNGAKIYEKFVKPARLDLLRVGAHYAISSLFEEYPQDTRIYCYATHNEIYQKKEAGKLKLSAGKTHVVSDVTWDEAVISFATLHLGDHNVNGGVRNFMGEEAFNAMQQEIDDAFGRTDVPEVIRLMDKHFGANNYSVWHLFRDEQRKVLNQILGASLRQVEETFRRLYEDHYPLMNFLQSLHAPLPMPLLVTTEYTLNAEVKRVFDEEEANTEKLQRLINEAKKWSLPIDAAVIGFVASAWINARMAQLERQPEDVPLMEKMQRVLKLLSSLAVEPNLWKAQNIYFSILQNHYAGRQESMEALAQNSFSVFRELGRCLHVKV